MMDLERFLKPIYSRIKLLIGRAIINGSSTGKNPCVDATLLADEKRTDIPLVQQFGFSSRPKGKTQAVIVFIGGSRDNGVAVATRGEDADMVANLAEGEALMHSPFGQKILFTKNGDVEVTVKPGKEIIYTADTFTVTGNLKVGGEVTAHADKLGLMVTLTGHLHPTGTGPSGKPTPGT